MPSCCDGLAGRAKAPVTNRALYSPFVLSPPRCLKIKSCPPPPCTSEVRRRDCMFRRGQQFAPDYVERSRRTPSQRSGDIPAFLVAGLLFVADLTVALASNRADGDVRCLAPCPYQRLRDQTAPRSACKDPFRFCRVAWPNKPPTGFWPPLALSVRGPKRSKSRNSNWSGSFA